MLVSRAKRALDALLGCCPRGALAWLLVAVGLLRLVGIDWGLPASDTWENDGVAPRDFLAGLVETVTPGEFYTYPPVHLVVLALLTAPITTVALVRAPSLRAEDVVAEIIQPPYMTSIAVVARLVSVAMSLGIVLFVARTAEELRRASLGDARGGPAPPDDPRVRRAGLCAGAFAGVNASLTYYAHTTNLDVPYLFWATGALLVLVRSFTRREPALYRRAFVLAVLAVATKDQAFALFAASVPAAFALVVGADRYAPGERRGVVRELLFAVALAAALFLVADGVVFNPSGFRARVAFLLGPASKDFVTYTDDWSGRLGVLEDAARFFERYYPPALAPIVFGGVVLEVARAWRAPRGRRGSRVAASTLPLFAAISFTVAFNLTARRTDHRFLLPQYVLFAIYGGLALEPLVFAARRSVRIASQAAASVVFAFALHRCMAVDAQLVLDPRYAAEAYLRAHVKPGETIETYGHNVYLPRFPDDARVVRVGPDPAVHRSPLPGVVEVLAPYDGLAARNPRFVVVTEGWVWRYLIDPHADLGVGRSLPPGQRRSATDPAATRYFQRLTRSMDEYAFVHGTRYESRWFPRLDIHASTSREVWIYERKEGR